MKLVRTLHKIRRLLCKMKLHRWTKWTHDGLYYIDYELDTDDGFFRFHYKRVYKRRCKTCSAKEERKINL